MLRANLSTRPFYNERAVHAALALAALIVLALTAFNVYRIMTLSGQNTELASRVAREHADAERLVQQAAQVRRTLNQDELETVVAAASEANALIDQRTFSWTAFFNQIEATLPPDVMITSVRPDVRQGQTRVALTVLGRRAEDVDEFMEKLEATGAFESVVPAQQEMTDEGLYQVQLQAVYTGLAEPQEAEPPAPPASAPDGAKPAAPAPDGARPGGRGGRP
jgi:Tfp pilus assembly protein PilN